MFCKLKLSKGHCDKMIKVVKVTGLWQQRGWYTMRHCAQLNCLQCFSSWQPSSVAPGHRHTTPRLRHHHTTPGHTNLSKIRPGRWYLESTTGVCYLSTNSFINIKHREFPHTIIFHPKSKMDIFNCSDKIKLLELPTSSIIGWPTEQENMLHLLLLRLDSECEAEEFTQ